MLSLNVLARSLNGVAGIDLSTKVLDKEVAKLLPTYAALILVPCQKVIHFAAQVVAGGSENVEEAFSRLGKIPSMLCHANQVSN